MRGRSLVAWLAALALGAGASRAQTPAEADLVRLRAEAAAIGVEAASLASGAPLARFQAAALRLDAWRAQALAHGGPLVPEEATARLRLGQAVIARAGIARARCVAGELVEARLAVELVVWASRLPTPLVAPDAVLATAEGVARCLTFEVSLDAQSSGILAVSGDSFVQARTRVAGTAEVRLTDLDDDGFVGRGRAALAGDSAFETPAESNCPVKTRSKLSEGTLTVRLALNPAAADPARRLAVAVDPSGPVYALDEECPETRAFRHEIEGFSDHWNEGTSRTLTDDPEGPLAFTTWTFGGAAYASRSFEHTWVDDPYTFTVRGTITVRHTPRP